MAADPDAPPCRQRVLLRAGMACWLAFALIAWWAASGNSAQFDTAGLELWRSEAGHRAVGPDWLTDIMRALTLIGGGAIRVALVASVLAVLLALRRWRLALMLTVTALPSYLINTGLKQLFSRPRPQLVEHLTSANGLSFPSGHAFNSAAAFLAVALALATLTKNAAARRMLVSAALLLAMLVAFSRVWMGVHYPTDVMAGWLGGVGWVLLVQALAGTGPTSKS